MSEEYKYSDITRKIIGCAEDHVDYMNCADGAEKCLNR